MVVADTRLPLQMQTAHPVSVPVAPKVFASLLTSWYGLSEPSALNSLHLFIFTVTEAPVVLQTSSSSHPSFRQSAPFGFVRAV